MDTNKDNRDRRDGRKPTSRSRSTDRTSGNRPAKLFRGDEQRNKRTSGSGDRSSSDSSSFKRRDERSDSSRDDGRPGRITRSEGKPRQNEATDRASHARGKADRTTRFGQDGKRSERTARPYGERRDDRRSDFRRPTSDRFQEGDDRRRDRRDSTDHSDRPARRFESKPREGKSKRFDERRAFPGRGDSRRSERPNRNERFGDRKSQDRPNRFERSDSRDRNAPRDFELGGKRYERNNSNERRRVSATQRGESTPRRRDKAIPRPQYTRTQEADRKQRTPDTPANMRLNRYIANAGICSRREADALIEQGLVKVNNLTVRELGIKVSNTDKVEVDGKVISAEEKVYVLLNKPRGFITTLHDPEGRRTVMELVASAGDERIYPVGRLDRETAGLLLFTNDGELADRLNHPRNEVKKIYHVELDKNLTLADQQTIENNEIELEDGKVHIDGFNLLDETRNKLGIQIHEGRNRLVRRIFEHLGYEVTKLDRTAYADLDKKDLPRGRWRYLKDKEVLRLKHFNIS